MGIKGGLQKAATENGLREGEQGHPVGCHVEAKKERQGTKCSIRGSPSRMFRIQGTKGKSSPPKKRARRKGGG